MNVDKYVLSIFSYKDILKPRNKGKFIGNRKCHVNSLSYCVANENKVDKIVGCIQVFYNDEAVVHFVVKLLDGSIIDPTYGNMSTTMYSYLIPIEEYKIQDFSPNRELENLKKYVYSKLPWYIRLFTKVERL